jgi:hypothetical protein
LRKRWPAPRSFSRRSRRQGPSRFRRLTSGHRFCSWRRVAGPDGIVDQGERATDLGTALIPAAIGVPIADMRGTDADPDGIVDQEAHATAMVMAPIQVATGAPTTDSEEPPLRAVKPISCPQLNGGYGADSGPSQSDPCKGAFRPLRQFAGQWSTRALRQEGVLSKCTLSRPNWLSRGSFETLDFG